MSEKTKVQSKEKFKKHKFKMPHAWTTLMIVVIFVIFLTWIIPSSIRVVTGNKVDSTKENFIFVSSGVIAFGILDTFQAVGNGFVSASDLLFFLLMFGGFLQIMVSSGAMESGVASLIKKLNGKEIILIPILMLLFAFGGTTFGMSSQTPPFYIILVPVLVLSGFDAATGTMTVLLGAGVGVMGSTVNPFMIGAASSSASEALGKDIAIGDGIWFRFVSWFILVSIAISFVTWYAWKVKKDKKHSILTLEELKFNEKKARESYDLDNAPEFTNRRKWLITILFVGIILLVILIIPWDKLLGIEDTPNDIPGSADFAPWLSRLIPALGDWKIINLGFLFLLLAIIAGMISGLDEKSLIDQLQIGFKNMIAVAMVISIARGVSIVLGGVEETANVILEGDDTNGGTLTIKSNVGEWVNALKNDVNKMPDLSSLKWIGNTLKLSPVNFGDAKEYMELLSKATNVKAIVDNVESLNVFTLVINAKSSISNTILNGMSSGLNGIAKAGVGPVIMLIQTPMAFLIPSTSGLSAVSMPIFAPVADTIGGSSAVAHTINGTAFASGWMNLFTPSSGIVMIGLGIGNIEWTKWIKLIWPLLVVLYITSMILMTIPSF